MLCSAADELSEADLKKIYKLSSKGDNIHTKEYEITEGMIHFELELTENYVGIFRS